MEQELIPIGIKEEVEKAVKELVDGGEIEKIETPEQYQAAGALTKQVRGSLKLVKEKRESLTQPLEHKKKAIIKYFKPFEETFKRIQTNADNVVGEWHREKERIRIEENKKREEAARKEKAKEIEAARKKREDEERKREAAEEAKRKADAEKDEEKKAALKKEASKLENAADKDNIAAQSHEDTAELVTAAPVDNSSTKIKGLSHKEIWIAHVVDIEAVLQYVIETKQYGFVAILEKVISDVATKLGGSFVVPGINFIKGFKTRGRAA